VTVIPQNASGTAPSDDEALVRAFDAARWDPPHLRRRSLSGVARLGAAAALAVAVLASPVLLLALPSTSAPDAQDRIEAAAQPLHRKPASPPAGTPAPGAAPGIADGGPFVDPTGTPATAAAPTGGLGFGPGPTDGAPPPVTDVPVTEVTVTDGSGGAIRTVTVDAAGPSDRRGAGRTTGVRRGTARATSPSTANPAATGPAVVTSVVTAGGDTVAAPPPTVAVAPPTSAVTVTRTNAAGTGSPTLYRDAKAVTGTNVARPRTTTATVATRTTARTTTRTVTSTRTTTSTPATRTVATQAARAVTVTVKVTSTTRTTSQPTTGWLTPAMLSAAGLSSSTTIRDPSGNYLVPAVNDSNPSDYALVRAVGSSGQKYTLVSLGGDTWAIRAAANGLYWCAEIGYTGNGYAQIRARSRDLGSYEQFKLYRFEDGRIAIKSVVNGKYLRTEPGYPDKFRGMVRASSSSATAFRFG
jgi:hypothetical protein